MPIFIQLSSCRNYMSNYMKTRNSFSLFLYFRPNVHPGFIQNVYTDDMYLNTLNRPNTRRSIDHEYSYEKPSKTVKPEDSSKTSSSTGFTRRKSDPESRRRRQAWYDNKYIENKLEEVNKKFKKSDYLLLDDLMTYEEAMDKCHEQVWLTGFWRHVTFLSTFCHRNQKREIISWHLRQIWMNFCLYIITF